MRVADLARKLYKDPMKLTQHQVARRVRASWNRSGRKKVDKIIHEAEVLVANGHHSAGLIWAIAGFEVLMRSIIGAGLKAVVPLRQLAEKFTDDFFLGNAKADRFRRLIPLLLGMDFAALDPDSWRVLTNEKDGAIRKRNRAAHHGDGIKSRDARRAIQAVKRVSEAFGSKIHELAPDPVEMLVQVIIKGMERANEVVH